MKKSLLIIIALLSITSPLIANGNHQDEIPAQVTAHKHELEGAIAITTTPRETEIYIDNQLITKKTPIVIRLPIGEHKIKIQKEGKQDKILDILIRENVVLSEKIILLDLTDSTTSTNHAFGILNPKRDAFETEEEFQQRRVQLLNQFNQKVQQHNVEHQAGIASLDKQNYNIESQMFPLYIEWETFWQDKFDLPKQAYITAKRDDAKLLWELGKQKPLYLYVESQQETLKLTHVVLFGLGKEWLITFDDNLPNYLLVDQVSNNKTKISLATFSPNSKILASVFGKSIHLQDAYTGKLLRTLEGHQNPVSSITFSPNSHVLASGGQDHTIKLWKISTGELLRTLGAAGLFFSDGHKQTVNALTFTPNGKQLVSGGADNTVKIWDLNTGKVLHTLKGHQAEVTSLAITMYNDITLIASGSQDKTIKLWFDTIPIYTLTGHTDTIQSLIFSAKENLLASSSLDKTVKLWKIPPCGQATTLNIEQNITSMAFNSNVNTLALINESEIQLWNFKQKKVLKTLALVELGENIIFSSDGEQLLSVDKFNNIKIWENGAKIELHK
ncbi:MAG: PEGA domain-containing protein [Thiomargarita sp.]|nr:PEGA domain-containing protein [Thiomargarita sp.]